MRLANTKKACTGRLKEEETKIFTKAVRDIEEAIKKILNKRAKGYLVKETSSDFALQDGEMIEVKRKISKKYIPPDISAIKIIIDEKNESFAGYSDEELENEMSRLLKILSASDDK